MASTGAWLIRRTRPVKETLGYSIPTFIHNWHFHLSTVDVFADGAVSTGGGLTDLVLFHEKARSGCIAAAPPAGSRMFVFNLGHAEVAEASWLQTPADIVRGVEDAIAELNPDRVALVGMADITIEYRGRSQRIRLGSNRKPCLFGPPPVAGAEVPIFRRSGDGYVLDRWFVFADGTSRVGANGPLEPLRATNARAEDGELRTAVPNDARITIPGLGSARVTNCEWEVDIRERVKEVNGLLMEAQGSNSTRALCVRALDTYRTEPNPQKWLALKVAYDAVPDHLRQYCDRTVDPDRSIRAIITAGPPR